MPEQEAQRAFRHKANCNLSITYEYGMTMYISGGFFPPEGKILSPRSQTGGNSPPSPEPNWTQLASTSPMWTPLCDSIPCSRQSVHRRATKVGLGVAGPEVAIFLRCGRESHATNCVLRTDRRNDKIHSPYIMSDDRSLSDDDSQES